MMASRGGGGARGGGGFGGRGGGGNGGRGGRGGRHNKVPSAAEGIDEEFQISVQRALQTFKTADDSPPLVFPGTLSPVERKFVHFVANQCGLASKSSGSKKGDNRQITVSRKRGPAVRLAHREPDLRVSPAAEALLAAHFEEWPISAGELQAIGLPPPAPGVAASLSDPRRSGQHSRHRPVDPASLRGAWGSARAAREAHSEYRRVMEGRTSLPAWVARNEVVHALKNHRVVIVCGETGCGKSTQVPQFLLDSEELGPTANAIVTQPRRISAISLAERVAAERCEPVGQTVGYNVRLESATSAATRLLFCTTGVLLRRLTGSASSSRHEATDGATTIAQALEGVTHIILDEVHERELNCDFLLALLRDALSAQPRLTLVLMSATIQLDMFRAYFQSAAGPAGPAVVRMAGSAYPVTRYYLEDVLLASGYLGNGRMGMGGGGGSSRMTPQDKQAQAARLANLVARVKGEVLMPDQVDGTDPSSSSSMEGRAEALPFGSPGMVAGAAGSSGRAGTAGGARSAAVAQEGDISPSTLRCSLCGRRRFESLEDFGMHAALCFGEPSEEGEEEVEGEEGEKVPASKGEASTGVPLRAQPEAAALLHRPAAPAPIFLPGGAKAKALAKEAGGSSGTTPGVGPSTSSDEASAEGDADMRIMLDEYQSGLPDEDSVDIDLIGECAEHRDDNHA